MKIVLKGFTLAEVLITLAIIGIVASLTLPSLIENHNERVLVVKVNKAYALLENAFRLSVIENGTPDTWPLTADISGYILAFNNFAPHLKFLKKCGIKSGCFGTKSSKYGKAVDFEGSSYINNDGNKVKGILADGDVYCIWKSGYYRK